MIKNCSACQTKKELSEFNKNKSKKDGLASNCRECAARISRKYYSENQEKHKKLVMERKSKVLEDNKRFIFEHLSLSPCADCGEQDPIVLDFDHLPGSDKRASVTELLQNHCSLKTLKKEIDKCEVVCSNCHRRRTAKRGNHYRWRLSQEIEGEEKI